MRRFNFASLLGLLCWLAPLAARAQVAVVSGASGTPTGVFGSVTAPTLGQAIAASASLTGTFRVMGICTFTAGAPVALDVTNITFAVAGTTIGGRLLTPAALNTIGGSPYVLDRVTLAAQTVSLIAVGAGTAGVTYACTLYTWSVY